jgi:hypothetical protein
MSNYLTEEQVAKLLEPIHPRRVSSRDGLAYVEAHDIKAHLTRIFGFARWSSEVIDQQLIAERQVQTKGGKDAFYVCYRSIVRLTVCAPDGTPLATYTEGHVGDSTHPVQGDAHGNALTNSESYALKRCCIALGDQFGLSLYNKGQTSKIVGRTLVAMPGENTKAADVDADVPQIHPEEHAQHGPEVQPEPEPAPPAPAADDIPTPPEVKGSSKQEIAAELVDKLNAIDFTQGRAQIMRQVLALKLAAGKAKILTFEVDTRDGKIPLGVMMDSAISAGAAA